MCFISHFLSRLNVKRPSRGFKETFHTDAKYAQNKFDILCAIVIFFF
jgi:hypothetical protein